MTWGYVEIHGSGFPLMRSDPFNDRKEAVAAANEAYLRAVKTGRAAGIRFGTMDAEGHVKGKPFMTKSHSKYPDGPFK